MSKVLEVFIGVNMSKQHDGLAAVAKKYKVDLSNMPQGSSCVFISRDRCRMKIVAWNGVLSYIRTLNRTRPFQLNALGEFHKAFNSDGNFSYEKALRMHLEKVFEDTGLLKEKKLG